MAFQSIGLRQAWWFVMQFWCQLAVTRCKKDDVFAALAFPHRPGTFFHFFSHHLCCTFDLWARWIGVSTIRPGENTDQVRMCHFFEKKLSRVLGFNKIVLLEFCLVAWVDHHGGQQDEGEVASEFSFNCIWVSLYIALIIEILIIII